MHAGRWASILLLWNPTHGSRKWGHPKLRWEDDIGNVFSQVQNSNTYDWITFAMDAQTWEEFGRRYVMQGASTFL